MFQSAILVIAALLQIVAAAQVVSVAGTARDETGGFVPGVTVELRQGEALVATVTDSRRRYSLSADVTVTGESTFTNLAEAREPSQNLIGIARSASQGAITARQIEMPRARFQTLQGGLQAPGLRLRQFDRLEA